MPSATRAGPGTLYVIATPLGNLEDITLRASRILGEVECVACEDTRHSGRLLRHLGVRPARLVSYHAHNEAKRSSELVEVILQGQNIALISDAGTPAISDPGDRLVRACHQAGIAVVPIPGPSAVIAAVSASGAPGVPFRFVGFIPRDSSREACLEAICSSEDTIVAYESPQRVLKTLRQLATRDSSRKVVLCREMTKIHEEIREGSVAEIVDLLEARETIRGEICLVFPPQPRAGTPVSDDDVSRLLSVLEDEGVSSRSARNILATFFSMGRKTAYDRVISARRLDTPRDEP